MVEMGVFVKNGVDEWTTGVSEIIEFDNWYPHAVNRTKQTKTMKWNNFICGIEKFYTLLRNQ
jgi:hypothetical protein